MGNTQVIRQGDVQVMSAGTGIQHSEKNKNHDQPVEFFQIWVIPNQKNVEPVSYTHLRAHETVLDLVCRLLLEKKKNTNS